ncbi:MAG: cupin domain-containing protein [Zoogloea sp.]|nr:cupin domain-containing protein [Zoogloea sp.]
MTENIPLLGACIDAASLPLHYEALADHKVLTGSPRPLVGMAVLAGLGDCEIGVWEIGPSTTTDVETDEVFLVLFGEATVKFDDGSADLVLKAGSLARLRRNARTTWHVTQTLRKVFCVSKTTEN